MLMTRAAIPSAARRFRFWCEMPTAAPLFQHMPVVNMYTETIDQIPAAVAAQTYEIIERLRALPPARRALNFSGWLCLRELERISPDRPEPIDENDVAATRYALAELLRTLKAEGVAPSMVYADPESHHTNQQKAEALSLALEGFGTAAAWYIFAGRHLQDGHSHAASATLEELGARRGVNWLHSNTLYFDTFRRPQHPAGRSGPWCWLIDAVNNATALTTQFGSAAYCPVIATPLTHVQPTSTLDPDTTLEEAQAAAVQWYMALTAALVELGTRNFVIFNHTAMNGQRYEGANDQQQAAAKKRHDADDAAAAEWFATLADMATTPARIPAPIPYNADSFTVGRWRFNLAGSLIETIATR